MSEIQEEKLRTFPTPGLDAILARHGHKTFATLLCELGAEPDTARQHEDALVIAATAWRRLDLLDGAARAACALVELEPEVFDAHMNTPEVVTSPAQRAYVVARAILNDAALALDDARPFDVADTLSLEQLSRALAALFIDRTGWHFELISPGQARRMVLASELTHDSWLDRVARLARDYEKQTYPDKVVSGSSST